MASSEVEIANVALTILGEGRIISIDDDVKAARDIKAIFNTARNALLGGYAWSFALMRASLPALASVPAFGFGKEYQIPTGCLRIVQVGEFFPGLDLTDYRGAPTETYIIEGRKILTNLEAPLKFRGVDTITDPAQFSPNFTMAFAAYIASLVAESLTGSDQKKQFSLGHLSREIGLAVRANAIELPPKKLADDEWLMSRL